jgi:hypothetical protein
LDTTVEKVGKESDSKMDASDFKSNRRKIKGEIPFQVIGVDCAGQIKYVHRKSGKKDITNFSFLEFEQRL